MKVIIKIILFIQILFIIKYSFVTMIVKIFFKNNKNIVMKKIVFSRISKITNRNINSIHTLFIKYKIHFGNYFIGINNAIIYCEFLGCKKIIIPSNNKIYINNTIFYKERNITIETNQKINSMGNNLVTINVFYFYLNGFKWLRNIIRLKLFQKTLLNNLPKVQTHPSDLYIYIRSGDIFQYAKDSWINYFQPPLCFYIKILDQFKFRKVFIISEDKLNPTIPKLLNKYSYIKQKKNNLKLDISYLINSYNAVAAKSTFFFTIMKLNDRLKFLWEFYCYSTNNHRYLQLHYSVYDFPFYYTIYKMNCSTNYKNSMYPWFNLPNQKKRMIEEKCINDFDIVRH